MYKLELSISISSVLEASTLFSTFIVLFLLQVSCLKVANVRITVNVDNIATPSNGNVVNDFDGFI